MLIAGSIYLVVSRRDMLRSEHRLDSLLSRESIFLANNLVLVGLCFVIFWGTYFPLISEALTGQEASVGPPWFDRYTVPLALILVLLSGIGPVIAWRRATLANARRNFLVPAGAAALGGAARAARRAASTQKPLGDRDVLLRGVRVRQHRPGVLPRRARAAGDGRREPRRSRCWRSCGATAGATAATSSTSASRCCSSASPPPRPSSTPPSWASRPGQSTRVGSYTVRYVRPTATITPKYDAAHTGSTLSLGAVLDVTKHGRHVATLYPSEGFYASEEASQGSVGSLIGGQPVSHVAMDAGHHARHVDARSQPDIEAPALQRIVKIGNSTLPPEEAVVAIAYLARAYLQHPPQAQFHFIVSPLVMWIWIGGLIVLQRRR